MADGRIAIFSSVPKKVGGARPTSSCVCGCAGSARAFVAAMRLAGSRCGRRAAAALAKRAGPAGGGAVGSDCAAAGAARATCHSRDPSALQDCAPCGRGTSRGRATPACRGTCGPQRGLSAESRGRARSQQLGRGGAFPAPLPSRGERSPRVTSPLVPVVIVCAERARASRVRSAAARARKAAHDSWRIPSAAPDARCIRGAGGCSRAAARTANDGVVEPGLRAVTASAQRGAARRKRAPC